jgi:hypothetical protein
MEQHSLRKGPYTWYHSLDAGFYLRKGACVDIRVLNVDTLTAAKELACGASRPSVAVLCITTDFEWPPLKDPPIPPVLLSGRCVSFPESYGAHVTVLSLPPCAEEDDRVTANRITLLLGAAAARHHDVLVMPTHLSRLFRQALLETGASFRAAVFVTAEREDATSTGPP